MPSLNRGRCMTAARGKVDTAKNRSPIYGDQFMSMTNNPPRLPGLNQIMILLFLIL